MTRRIPGDLPSASLQPAGVCPELTVLALLTHYALFIDRACKLFVARRTPAPFESAQQIEACFDEIQNLLASTPRSEYALLVDVRQGPSRNDPAFEDASRVHRGKLLRGFAKNVALSATVVGGLQIQRYAKSDARAVFITQSESEALRHLGLGPHRLGE